MAIDRGQPSPRPHPVAFDVAYPERLSRWLIFVKWLLAIPQLIVIYLLRIVATILTFLSWFAILFTGRYPKAFFEFSSGVLRWEANVFAYVGLLRDEYPPFSWEPGEYPLTLDIDRVPRQSRFRLFIRWFAIIPHQIVFFFVAVAALFTTFLAWFAILFTGRYPRGLFKFGVGVMRWFMRMEAYQYLLRDEYPPYSVNAAARPGNEALSALLGIPLFAVYIAFAFLPFFGLLGEGQAMVSAGPVTSVSRQQPSAAANGLRITLLDYNPRALPPAAHLEVPRGMHLVSFRVRVEKDGFWPVVVIPNLFHLNDCYDTVAPYRAAQAGSGFTFAWFWTGGQKEGNVYFEMADGARPCELSYHAGRGRIRFEFR